MVFNNRNIILKQISNQINEQLNILNNKLDVSGIEYVTDINTFKVKMYTLLSDLEMSYRIENEIKYLNTSYDK